MSEPKKLIEVAMPIKEISAESVRDKSIRHGHISTLHLWWARRPLPICRAVVFASLVPDPLDENCPTVFKEAIDFLLGKYSNEGDQYLPYSDIPYTSAIDPMEDNQRNRLLMFIGKFSNKFLHNQKTGKTTDAKDLLSDNSLIKWDNKNNLKIIEIARKLIWVSQNGKNGKNLKDLLNQYNFYYQNIKNAESVLFDTYDREIKTEEILKKESELEEAINAFQNHMPIVFDPFAGGGAIPLEASRLGCKTYGNDINPVAHIIQRGSLEFPQKFGKQSIISMEKYINKYGVDNWLKLPNELKLFENGTYTACKVDNILSYDVRFYSQKLLSLAFEKAKWLYPPDKDGNDIVAYYWARVGVCNNPSCKAEVPMLRGFSLCKKKEKKISLNPIIIGNKITFEIVHREVSVEGFNKRGNVKCPCCGSITDVNSIKAQYPTGDFKIVPLAVISESKNGKKYRIPTLEEVSTLCTKIENKEVPIEKMQRNSAGGDLFSWGITNWGQVYNSRQLFVMNSLIESYKTITDELEKNKYNLAICTYLSIFIDRIASMSTAFGLWKDNLEAVVTPFSRQAIPIVFDYPEVNIFSNSTGSASNQIDWIIRYIESESESPFSAILQNASSGEKNQFPAKYLNAVITDPPYYDAIAYADISDFFYVWLKKTLSGLYPLNFSTPQTPKTEECTALKHHHNGSIEMAKKHFENKLLQIFDAIEEQTSEIVSIMFAHQSTEAWSTLCNSILGARMNINGSWAIDSEREVRGVALAGGALSSSVTVSCRPSQRNGIGEYKKVKVAIEHKVEVQVAELYKLGFRGADLLTACFGQAVSEFGKYEKVEKADGSDVTVNELLEMARVSAFNALLKGFTGDEYSKFYIGWLQLNGFMDTDFDDAAKFTKVGLSLDIQSLFKEHILIKNGNLQHLGSMRERIAENSKLGQSINNTIVIDIAHRLMSLYDSPNRGNLLKYIVNVKIEIDSSVWRVLTSLVELLPKEMDDYKLAMGLLSNKEQLLREANSTNIIKSEQSQLTFE